MNIYFALTLIIVLALTIGLGLSIPIMWTARKERARLKRWKAARVDSNIGRNPV